MCISSIQQCLPEEQRNSGELSALPTQQAREVEVAIRIAEFSARSKHPCDVDSIHIGATVARCTQACKNPCTPSPWLPGHCA